MIAARLRPALRVSLAGVLAAALSACSGVAPRQYQGKEPTFRVGQYFDGHVEAWGMFQGRDGEVRRRFTVAIDGHREGDEFVMEEQFEYDNGETDQRTWHIRRLDDHHYRGTAGDIVGVAEGTRYGNALNWNYTLALDVDGETWNVQLDDWMYLMQDGVLINRSVVSKLGFTVGEITIMFRKRDGAG